MLWVQELAAAATWTALGTIHCSAAHSSAHELDSVAGALEGIIKELLLQLKMWMSETFVSSGMHQSGKPPIPEHNFCNSPSSDVGQGVSAVGL